MIMMFAPLFTPIFASLFTAFSRQKSPALPLPEYPGMVGADGATLSTFGPENMPRRGINRNAYHGQSNGPLHQQTNGQAYQHALPTIHISSVSTGLNDSDNERLDGVVTIDIHPNRLGQIKFAGGWWSAKCGRSIILTAGTLVKVVARENIVLIVEPIGVQPHFMEKWTELV